ncbi:MAG: autotransporter-associated beta strand repeat-containing protein [Pirellulales bacterium]|nr:autotransporter-associated beta strand repeat-containing protein [Pirellulales bacterium]
MNKLLQLALVLMMVGFIQALPVQAQFYLCWDLASGEDWANEASLWFDPDGFNGVIPYSPDWAILKTPGLMKMDSSHMISAGRLYVGEGYNEFPYYLTGAGEGHVLQTSGDFWYDDYLLLGYWSPGTSTYTMEGGTILQVNRDPNAGAGQLRIGDHGDATMTVSNDAGIDVYRAIMAYGTGMGTTGTLMMSGDSSLTVQDYFRVGQGSSSGLITGTASATIDLYDTATITGNGYTVIGIWNNSQGIVNMHDSSRLIVDTAANDQHLVVGDSQYSTSINPSPGVGILNIHDNATVLADNFRIGNNNTGDGTVNLSSTTGTARLTVGRIYHGYVGSKGVLNIDDGGVLTQTTSYWHIGYNAMNGAHGNGIVNMNGGTIDRTSSTNYIAIGYLAADGTWNHNGGTLLNNDAGVIMGREDGFYGSGANATVNLNGGIFESGWFRTYAIYSLVPDSATLNLNGGLLRAKASGLFLGDGGPISVLKAVVQSGGAVIDSNGFNLGATTGLTDGGGGGGLIKQGAGILTLRGANTYTGATSLTGGGLTVTSTGSIATSDIKIADGTSLSIANPAAVGALGTLALGNGTTMEMALTPTAAGANDIQTNTLNLGGTTTLRIGAQGSTLDTISPYTVITQSALGGIGTINAMSLVRGTTAAAMVNPTSVTVAITGIPSAAKLEWSGIGTDWDVVGTSNWTNPLGIIPDKFYELDNVAFNNMGAANPNVNVVGRVHADAIVESGTTAYTFLGSGEIIADSLTKNGSGTLTVDNSGGFSITGNVAINGSTLSMGSNSGDNTFSGPVSLTNGAILSPQQWATLRLTGVVADDGVTGLNKTGAGTVVLDNPANTYTGVTKITNGAVVANTLANGGVPSSIGASPAAASNLRFSGHGALHYMGPSVTTNRGFGMDGDGWINIERPNTTLTMTGGVSAGATTGRLFKIGDGTLQLTSSGLNTIGTELVIYGGGVILDGPTGTEFTTTGSSFIGDNTDNYGNLVINNAKLTVGYQFFAGLDGANGDITLNGTAQIVVNDYTNFGGSGGDVTLTMNDDSLLSTRYGRIGGINQGATPGTVVIEMNDNAKIESVTTSAGDGAWLNIGEKFYTTMVTMNDKASISSSSHYDLGYGIQTDCTFVMNGQSSMTAVTAMRIGVYGLNAKGSLTMNESSTVTLGNELRVGAHAGSATGSLTMNGNSILSAGSDLWIGWDGKAAETPASGTVILNDYASLTFDTNGGGTWAHVGDNFGEGELIINDNASLSGTSSLAIGNWGNGRGTLKMTGNSSVSAVGIFIGNFYSQGNGIGEAFLSGNATMTSPGSDVEVAWGGTGILHIGDGTPADNVVVTAGTEVLLGWGTASGDSDATINLNGGGTLVTPLIRTGENSGAPAPLSSVLNFNGGTLKASADSADFISNAGGSLVFQVNVQSHGAVIDTDGHDIVINPPLLESGPGTLAGDFDLDGDVDGADFLVWQQGFGTSYDTADLADWKTNFGTTGGSSASGGLTKVGAGVLTLNGTNTYTGLTTVAEGTLGGTGSVAGDAVVNTGATIGPGQGIGTFSIAGDLMLDGTLLVEYSGSTIDLLTVGGNLDLTSASLDFSNLGALTNPSYTFLTFAGSRTSEFGTVSNLPAGYSVTYGANSVMLSTTGMSIAVPEPASWTITMIAVICVGCLRRWNYSR